MRDRLVVLAALALAICVGAHAASAAPIVYLDDLREIHASRTATVHSTGISKTASPDAPFSYFARTALAGEASAHQGSAMDAVQMTAIGFASTYQDIFTGLTSAYSLFQIQFEITEATPFTLGGTISREDTLGVRRGRRGGAAQLRRRGSLPPRAPRQHGAAHLAGLGERGARAG